MSINGNITDTDKNNNWLDNMEYVSLSSISVLQKPLDLRIIIICVLFYSVCIKPKHTHVLLSIILCSQPFHLQLLIGS